MNLNQNQILKILVTENYIPKIDLLNAEKICSKTGQDVIEYLIQNNILTKSLIGQAISEYLNLPYADLEVKPPTQSEVIEIPEDIARKYRVVVFDEGNDEVAVATSDTDHIAVILKELKSVFQNKKISINFSFEDEIEKSFSHYEKPLESRFKKIIEESNRVAPEIINEIIVDAINNKISDIHFEPNEENVKIRFRLDGVLQNAGELSKVFYESVLNRIKVKANIRIDEHNTPQDGAIRFNSDEANADLRISIIPTLNGEKIVIRILSEYVNQYSLESLGLSETDKNLITESIKKPFGMILTTGPTGSGKTTTLYSLIRSLNSSEINITTIEDPVEYRISGINQIQVNNQIDLTFAKGLRSIVRQDPNVILVGEIRDIETAEIAVNAALTGHLLLSTFHANDAATAIPRLIEMGIEPFLLASTLNLIVAQRLVRKICPVCRYSTDLHEDKNLEKPLAFINKYIKKPRESLTFYRGKGCKVCNNTGFNGRIALFEIIYVSEEIQDLILKNPSMSAIWEVAKRQGAHTFFEDGFEKVKNGITTLDELLRVAPITYDTDYVYGKK